MKLTPQILAVPFAVAALGLMAYAPTTAHAQDKMGKMDKMAPMSGKTIVEIAASNPNLSTLVTAVKAAGLVDTLNGAGPFTVFAPTNAAFAKIPKAKLNALLADKEALTKVLTYHVVSGEVNASAVMGLSGPAYKTTVEGSKILINPSPAMINNAKIVKPDIKASNGVIHVIDTVLMPGMMDTTDKMKMGKMGKMGKMNHMGKMNKM